MHAKEYFSSREDIILDLNEGMKLEGINESPGQTDEVAATQRADRDGSLAHSLPPQSSFDLGPPAQGLPESHVTDHTQVTMEMMEDPSQIKASRQDFYKYLFTEGNWTDLFATSMSWMLLDFTFYLLGVNSRTFVPRLFGENINPRPAPYRLFVNNERHIMEATCIGSVLGGAIAIVIMNDFSRKKIQMWGFLVLGPLFVVVGAMYLTLSNTNAHLDIVIFYGICQLFFNLGMLCNRHCVADSVTHLIAQQVQTQLPSLYEPSW